MWFRSFPKKQLNIDTFHARIPKKSRGGGGSRVYVFHGGGGESETYFRQFYFVNLGNFNFPGSPDTPSGSAHAFTHLASVHWFDAHTNSTIDALVYFCIIFFSRYEWFHKKIQDQIMKVIVYVLQRPVKNEQDLEQLYIYTSCSEKYQQ